MKKAIAFSLLVVIYLLVSAATYGYACDNERLVESEQYPHCQSDWNEWAMSEAFYDAAFWPIYLPGHLSRIYFQQH
jgi:hypothetical protein